MTGPNTARTHLLSPRHFGELAAGLGGPDAMAALSGAEYSKHVLLMRAIVELSGEGSAAHRGYRSLAAEQQRHPAAVTELLGRPEVGAWAADCLRDLVENRPGARPEHLVRLAALPPRTGLRCRAEHAGLVLDLMLDHETPFLHRYRYEVDRRPDARAWRRRLARAWRVLAEGHRAQAADMAAVVRTLVPLAPVPGLNLVSVTSPAAFGAVAMSLPADGVTLAETLVHEFQHVKLGALLDLLPLVDADAGERYYAPWRDDPRPLPGLLQGAYAYLGVAGFWRTQRFAVPDLSGHVEFARRRAEAFETTSTLLDSGRLTPEGTAFVTRMRRRLEEALADEVPDEALARAAELSAEHRRRWTPP